MHSATVKTTPDIACDGIQAGAILRHREHAIPSFRGRVTLHSAWGTGRQAISLRRRRIACPHVAGNPTLLLCQRTSARHVARWELRRHVAFRHRHRQPPSSAVVEPSRRAAGPPAVCGCPQDDGRCVSATGRGLGRCVLSATRSRIDPEPEGDQQEFRGNDSRYGGRRVGSTRFGFAGDLPTWARSARRSEECGADACASTP